MGESAAHGDGARTDESARATATWSVGERRRATTRASRRRRGGGPAARLLPWLILLALASLAVAYVRSPRVLPGVRVAGVDVGGLGTAQASARLERAWRDRQLEIVAEGRSSTVTAEEIGLTLDAGASARAARGVGRELAYWRWVIRGGPVRSLPAVWVFDRELALETLGALAPDLATDAVPTGLRIVGGAVEVVPAQDGAAVDVAATLSKLEAEVSEVLGSGTLIAVTSPVVPPDRDPSLAAKAAEERLASGIRVAAYDPILDRREVVDLEPGEWSRWVVPQVEPSASSGLAWAPRADHPAALEAWSPGPGRYLDPVQFAAAVAATLSGRQESVRVRHAPTSHAVRPGETIAGIALEYGMPYPWILEANPGMADEVWPGQTVAVPSPDVLVPLPPDETKRITVSLADQRVRAYERGELKWDWPASTGMAESPTSPGVYQVQLREPDAYARTYRLRMPFFVGIYRPDPRSSFMNGFHGYPTRDGAGVLWQGDLGRPVTYGCVLLDSANAAELYDWAEPGVVVEIVP